MFDPDLEIMVETDASTTYQPVYYLNYTQTVFGILWHISVRNTPRKSVITRSTIKSY